MEKCYKRDKKSDVFSLSEKPKISRIIKYVQTAAILIGVNAQCFEFLFEFWNFFFFLKKPF